jgi:hypothetical protein
LGFAALLVVAVGLCWSKWKHDEPRRNSVQTLRTFCQTLASKNPGPLLQEIVLPQALASRTAAEQIQFLQKALRDEISPEGVAELKRRASFGPLKEVFPAEANRWATQAGVKPENCFAFKMERAGVKAEVVLVREGQNLRVLRCNNVRAMAGGG